MSSIVLESPRLVFRSWRADDLDLAHALWGDPAVTRYLHAAPLRSRPDATSGP